MRCKISLVLCASHYWLVLHQPNRRIIRRCSVDRVHACIEYRTLSLVVQGRSYTARKNLQSTEPLTLDTRQTSPTTKHKLACVLRAVLIENEHVSWIRLGGERTVGDHRQRAGHKHSHRLQRLNIFFHRALFQWCEETTSASDQSAIYINRWIHWS